jgi:hypothetical protein
MVSCLLAVFRIFDRLCMVYFSGQSGWKIVVSIALTVMLIASILSFYKTAG